MSGSIPQYPWQEGDALFASALNAAIAAALASGGGGGGGASDADITAYFAALPTSDAGVAPGGMFWNGGFLNRVAGGVNQAALNAYVTAYNYLASQYSIAGTLIWSQSMGGCAGLLNLSAAAYPNIKGWLGTYPVCSLQNLYSAGTYAGQIDVAYNIPGGGSYATQTAGHDPLLRTAASFPYRMRWYASPGDTVVNEAGNSTAMVALVNGIAIENVLVPCTGDHGDPTHFQPTDYVTFAQRCFA